MRLPWPLRYAKYPIDRPITAYIDQGWIPQWKNVYCMARSDVPGRARFADAQRGSDRVDGASALRHAI
jgi:hypothetical protein